MLKNAAKTLLFLFLCLLIVFGLSALLTPAFEPQRTTIRGMYDQPENSVEVVALGQSTLLDGFSPMRLYEKHGIASYNCGSYFQAPLVSYWLLQEMLRLNGKSTKVVIIDATSVTNQEKDLESSEFVERVAAQMPLSPAKVGLAIDASREFGGTSVAEYLLPVLRFHDRWSELTEDDFDSLFTKPYDNYGHGQNIFYKTNLVAGTAGKFANKNADEITDEINYGEDELTALWDEKSVEYLDKTLDACAQNNIDVLMVRTATSVWSDKEHDSINLYAKKRGVPFFDFNQASLWNACGFSFDYDYADSRHPALFGSLKLTDWLGDYLVEHYELTDIRGTDAGAKMDDDLAAFNKTVKFAHLAQAQNLNDYLALLDDDQLDVFVVVNGEAARGLDDATREQLKTLGFEKLAKLGENSSYAGIRTNGEVIREALKKDGEKVTIDGAYHDGVVNIAKTNTQNGTSIDHALNLLSIGADSGRKGEVFVFNKNRAEDKPGLNFVVCDRRSGDIVDNATFDTHTGLNRISDLPKK